PAMPSPTPQPRQPAWASLGIETAASANTPAVAIAVIVVFMFLPRQGMIALRSSGCTQVSTRLRFHPRAGWCRRMRMPPSRRPQAHLPQIHLPEVVRPTGAHDSDEPIGIAAAQFTQPSQFVRNFLNAV